MNLPVILPIDELPKRPSDDISTTQVCSVILTGELQPGFIDKPNMIGAVDAILNRHDPAGPPACMGLLTTIVKGGVILRQMVNQFKIGMEDVLGVQCAQHHTHSAVRAPS